MKKLLAIALAATLSVPAISAMPIDETAPAARTVVNDRAALQRLQRNSGITLQWISFNTPRRGHVVVRENGGLYTLAGSQASQTGRGLLMIEGNILSVDSDRFTFQGRIAISNTPDADRQCIRNGTYEFRVTQNRRYWRLQQMQECGTLTDYVDIYF